MLPVWLFDFLRFDDKSDNKSESDNIKKCICSKSFTNENKPIMCETCLNVQCDLCWLSDNDLKNNQKSTNQKSTNQKNNQKNNQISTKQNDKLHCPNCFSLSYKIVPYILLTNNETKTSEKTKNECAICMHELTELDPLLYCGHSICYNDFMKWYYSCDGNNDGNNDENIQKPIKCIVCQQLVNRVALNGFKLKETTQKTPIEIWDFRFLFLYLKQENIFEEKEITKAIAEYRNFMFAKQQTRDEEGLILSPCPIVDTIWHTHILFTEDYQKFCETIIGFYVHHRPNGKYETEQKQERFKRTINWFYENDIAVDNNIWSFYDSNENDSNKNNSKIQICIKTSTRTQYYTVSLDSRIWNIKSMLHNEWSCAPCDQRIIWAGKELDDNVKIADIYDKFQKNNSNDNDSNIVFYMILKLKGC